MIATSYNGLRAAGGRRSRSSEVGGEGATHRDPAARPFLQNASSGWGAALNVEEDEGNEAWCCLQTLVLTNQDHFAVCVKSEESQVPADKL